MSKVDYLKIAEDLVAKAKKKGANQIQVSINSGTKFSVDVREGEVEQLVEAGTTGLSIKVIVDNKVASSSSSDLKPETLERMLDNAIERAKYTGSDEFAALPELETINFNIDDLKMYDPEIEKLTPEYKIQTAKKLEKLCLADKRITRSSGASFGNYVGERFLVNSNGFKGAFKHSSVSYSIGLQAGEGDGIYEDGWGESSCNVKGLAPVEEAAKTAIERVTRMVGAKKIPTQNVPVVFCPEMTSSIILHFLIECLSGNSIYMKRSCLTGKMGQKIASDLVSITDDPFIPAGPGTEPFDGEGVPARKLDVITKGVLNTYLMGTYSARKLKLKATGPAPTNFRLQNGKHSQEEIIKSVDKGLFLLSTIGQGTVATSGDISKGAYGIWIENGKLTYPGNEITISGNLIKILNDIEMVGNDLEPKEAISGPTVKVKEMTISGS